MASPGPGLRAAAPGPPTLRTIPEGIRITKVGLWYIVLTVVVAVPAVNTGNNALYLVEACLLGLLIVSGFASRQNVRRLEVEVTPPSEAFAKQPFSLRYRVRHRGRWMARRLLVLRVVVEGTPALVPYLPRGEHREGRFELMVERRGRLLLPHVHAASIFPLGLFRKGMRYPVGSELLVFPEILAAPTEALRPTGRAGELAAEKAGSGHELFSLRTYRRGDDRRGIHWKQTARTGELIFMEREEEKGNRVSIELDNAVGELASPEDEERFERLVSQAATAGCHYLAQDYEVELRTRSGSVPYGRGRRQRQRILEHLALLEAAPATGAPLGRGDAESPTLRLDLASVGE